MSLKSIIKQIQKHPVNIFKPQLNINILNKNELMNYGYGYNYGPECKIIYEFVAIIDNRLRYLRIPIYKADYDIKDESDLIEYVNNKAFEYFKYIKMLPPANN